jgi:hypothetical protein
MLSFLEREHWEASILKERSLFFNEKNDFVDAVANSFNLKVHHILFKKGDKTIVSLIAYAKGDRIVVPLYFVYSTLWINKISDSAYSTYVTAFLAQLKLHFKNISLNLNPAISDVRPFIWSGFNVAPKYTYIKDLNIFANYPSDVKSSIKKAIDSDVEFIKVPFSEELVAQNMIFLRNSTLLSSDKISGIMSFFNVLKSDGKLEFYICTLKNELIASSIVLVDDVQKVAYTAFLNKVELNSFGNHSIHAFLYDGIFKSLSQRGYQMVDLLGANVFSISKFKGKLQGDLIAYYSVEYKNLGNFLNKSLITIKKILKKALMR